MEIIERVIDEITPQKEEVNKLNMIYTEVFSIINKNFLLNGINAQVVAGGSYARNTFLKNSHDIDIFVRLEKKDINKFSKIILSCFPNAERLKGTREYFKIVYKGVEVEILPLLKIDDPTKSENNMDASYFHVDYLNARLNKKLRNEVRLLKQFCKANGVYGAESHIGGFSGYVIELIILKFKSFLKFLEYIEKLRGNMFLDLEGYYDTYEDAVEALNINEETTPVIVVDPVLPTRNAAGGIRKSTFEKFILCARLFLRKPSMKFFKIKEKTINDIKNLAEKRGHSIYTYKLEPGKPDVFFAKLRKQLEIIKYKLEKEDFVVYDYGFLNDGTIYFEFEIDKLPPTKRVIGPPVNIEAKHFDAFLKKKFVHGPYVFNGFICVDVERKYTRVKNLLNELIKELKKKL